MIDLMKLATCVQALLERELARSIAIVDAQRAPSPPAGPAVVIARHSYGDIYSGATLHDSIAVVNLPVNVRFDFMFHDLSGQCDGWKLVVDKATPAVIAELRTVFASSQYTGHWRDGEQPVIVADGATTPL